MSVKILLQNWSSTEWFTTLCTFVRFLHRTDDQLFSQINRTIAEMLLLRKIQNRNTKNISWEMKSQIFLSLADDETPNTSSDSESVTLSEKEMQNGKQNKSKAHTMTNPSMQKLWEIFHLLLRHQRRRMSSTAVHPSMEFLMQLLVVGLFLVLLLYLYLAFTTINFLLWLCTLQVLKDLNPNSAGLFCRNVCQLVSSDGLPHPPRRWHRQTAPILDKYFCKVHDSLWKSSCRLSSSPAQDLVASKITC